MTDLPEPFNHARGRHLVLSHHLIAPMSVLLALLSLEELRVSQRRGGGHGPSIGRGLFGMVAEIK